MMLDDRNMLASIDMLADQVQHAWDDTATLLVPDDYKNCRNVVLFGMGGSMLAMDIIKAVFADQATVPLLISNDYSIPAYVNQDTLVILSSYSGTTEETLTVAKTIFERTNKVMVITTGGDLKKIMDDRNLPGYCIEPNYNPCGQPRIAVGYAVIGVLRMLAQADVVTVTDTDIDNVVHYLRGNLELLRDAGQATADALSSKIPVYVGSEFLLGNLHTVSNQTNENGKQFSCWFALPELNHHLLEGLGFPQPTVQQLSFVFVESNLYHDRVQKRYDVTKQVLEKQRVSYTTFIPTASSKLLQAFEVLQWGSFVSFYLSQQNVIDPSPIPWVDFFKNALKR